MPRSEVIAWTGRGVLLALAILSVGVNALFGFTNRAWVLMGSPSESYPEFFFIGVGLPLALTGLAGALSGLWTGRSKRRGSLVARVVLWIAIGAVLISALLATWIFLPSRQPSPNAVADGIFSGLFLFSPLLLLVQLALSAFAAFTAGRR